MIELGPALGGRSLLPCLAAWVAAAGRPREAPVLAGLAGHPFETSHAPGGGELWSCCALEWSRFAWTGRLGLRQETERGVPALVWSPRSAAQKAKGLGAFCWGVVEGVDRGSRECLVVHRDAGRFRTPAGEVGRVDAGQWFHAATGEAARDGRGRGAIPPPRG